MRLDVILEKDEDGFYVASCPAVKGCHSQGRTKREALVNIREAIGATAAATLSVKPSSP